MSEVTVKVARVTLRGDPKIEIMPGVSVQVPAGQDLVVKVPFTFAEASEERDDYTVLLRSTLGPHKAKDSKVTLRDQPVVVDEGIGMIQQRYRRLQPGTYALDFEVLAEWQFSPWSGGARKDGEATASGELQVVVE